MPRGRGWHRPLLVIYRFGADLPIVTIDTNLSVNPKTVQCVDDTSVIVKNPNFTDFEKFINMDLKNMVFFKFAFFKYL
jgi:hypothetical protein